MPLLPGIIYDIFRLIIASFKTSSGISSAGLTPQCNESAGKKKSVHISRAGVYIKPLLIQCSNNAIRDKTCPYFKLRYDAIKKRRGHKRAIIAISRMLLTCIYQMLSKNEPFNHEIYEQLAEKHFKSKDKKLNINNAIKFYIFSLYIWKLKISGLLYFNNIYITNYQA